MPTFNYVLIDESERFKLLATYLDTNKLHKVLVLFGTPQQIQFFDSVLTNLNPKLPLNFGLIDSPDDLAEYQQVILLDVPNTFEGMTNIVNGLGQKAKLVLFLFKINRDYVKMLGKKLQLEFKELTFNPHKCLMVEDKFLQIVDSNYAINRQAFYAYGSFLQHFNKNLLKRIFRTDRLNMKAVGMGFGMPVPPKVNMEAKFLTQKAQLKQKALKRKEKIRRLRQAKSKAVQQPQEDIGQVEGAVPEEKPARRVKKIQKVKKIRSA